jgi:hypothetical protein
MKRNLLTSTLVVGLFASTAGIAVAQDTATTTEPAVTPVQAPLQGDAPVGGALQGGMGPLGGMMDFATLDADGNGQVTAEEITAAAAARFAAADTDGDGGISAAEMVAAAEAARVERLNARMAQVVERFDDNGDGVIQITELSARVPGPELALDMLDTDGDGAISAAEFDAMRERMGDRGNGGPMGRPGDNGPGNQRPGGDGHGMQGFWQRWGN